MHGDDNLSDGSGGRCGPERPADPWRWQLRFAGHTARPRSWIRVQLSRLSAGREPRAVTIVNKHKPHAEVQLLFGDRMLYIHPDERDFIDINRFVFAESSSRRPLRRLLRSSPVHPQPYVRELS